MNPVPLENLPATCAKLRAPMLYTQMAQRKTLKILSFQLQHVQNFNHLRCSNKWGKQISQRFFGARAPVRDRATQSHFQVVSKKGAVAHPPPLPERAHCPPIRNLAFATCLIKATPPPFPTGHATAMVDLVSTRATKTAPSLPNMPPRHPRHPHTPKHIPQSVPQDPFQTHPQSYPPRHPQAPKYCAFLPKTARKAQTRRALPRDSSQMI